jgi:hypothetical protein
MGILKLGSYRKKGINAYAVPLQGLQFSTDDYDFGQPLTEADRAAANKSGFHKVGIDLSQSKFLDSYLRYKEAIGHKSAEGFLEVVNGEAVNSWESEADYAIYRASKLLELPPLQGTAKQIAWAESIRAKSVLYLHCNIGIEVKFHSDFFQNKVQAHDWIEGFNLVNSTPSAIAHFILQQLK